MISTLEKYAKYFVPQIPKTPTGRYASIILLRETKSYAIFTTEGGQQQDVEQTQAGLSSSKPADRLVMFKRKQVAPERRTGKALFRQYRVFPYALKQAESGGVEVAYGNADIEQLVSQKGEGDSISTYEDCYLTEGLCTHCPDCLTYGYAAIEGGGSKKGTDYD